MGTMDVTDSFVGDDDDEEGVGELVATTTVGDVIALLW